MWKKTRQFSGFALPALAALALNACTAMLWGMFPASNTETISREIGSDQVRAFGVVRDKNSQLAVGSLVMMGDKYWYVVDLDSSQKTAAVLNAGLPQRYAINKGETGGEGELSVYIEPNQRFRSSFCLKYTPEQPQEAAKLEQLGFKRRKAGQEEGKEYIQCFDIAGSFYAKPQQAKRDYRFESPVPVRLMTKESKTSVNAENLVRNLLFTPVTLALDAAGGVLMLPALLLGGGRY
ncbi:MAG: thiosulfate sulfurtransferase [Neisseria sp.]|nr:thiosulfate sulfurtransferase [Neisseria sp.]